MHYSVRYQDNDRVRQLGKFTSLVDAHAAIIESGVEECSIWGGGSLISEWSCRTIVFHEALWFLVPTRDVPQCKEYIERHDIYAIGVSHSTIELEPDVVTFGAACLFPDETSFSIALLRNPEMRYQVREMRNICPTEQDRW